MNLNEEIICGHLVTAEKKKINAVYLELLQEFDRLCEAHGLTYWLVYGALIGAVRHKGFIPWDDDVDILLPREDFDRLQAMTNADFGVKEPYFLQNENTDPTYHQPLMRFRRSDTSAVMNYDLVRLREYPHKNSYNMGMCLSIFPLDRVPKNRRSFALRRKIAYIIMGIDYRANRSKKDKPLFHKLCRAIEMVVGPRNMVNLMHACYRCPEAKAGNTVNSLDGFYTENCQWPAEDFRETLRMPFEDITVPVPSGYDHFLTVTYGDYMQLPPEEKRIDKHGGFMRADVPYKKAVELLLSGEADMAAPL